MATTPNSQSINVVANRKSNPTLRWIEFTAIKTAAPPPTTPKKIVLQGSAAAQPLMDLASIVRPPVVAQTTEGTGYQLIANPETLDWLRQRASSRAGSSTRVLCLVVDPLPVPIEGFDAALVEKVWELLTGRLPGRKATLIAATLRTSHNLVLVKPPQRDVLREVSMRLRTRSRRPQ